MNERLLITLLLIVLVAGVIVSGSLAMREASAKRDAIAAAILADAARVDAVSAQRAESEQRERAEREATIAKAVSTYLQDTFSAPDPWSEGPSETIRANRLRRNDFRAFATRRRVSNSGAASRFECRFETTCVPKPV